MHTALLSSSNLLQEARHGNTPRLRQTPEFTNDPLLPHNGCLHGRVHVSSTGCGRHRDERGYFDVEVKPGAKNDRMNCQTVARGDHENGFSGLGGA